jgi:hypothetical protein
MTTPKSTLRVGRANPGLQDWDRNLLMALVSNGLDAKMYPDKESLDLFMKDREVFENFLTFLKM